LTINSEQLMELAVKAAEDKKGMDVVALNLKGRIADRRLFCHLPRQLGHSGAGDRNGSPQASGGARSADQRHRRDELGQVGIAGYRGRRRPYFPSRRAGILQHRALMVGRESSGNKMSFQAGMTATLQIVREKSPLRLFRERRRARCAASL